MMPNTRKFLDSDGVKELFKVLADANVIDSVDISKLLSLEGKVLSSRFPTEEEVGIGAIGSDDIQETLSSLSGDGVNWIEIPVGIENDDILTAIDAAVSEASSEFHPIDQGNA